MLYEHCLLLVAWRGVCSGVHSADKRAGWPVRHGRHGRHGRHDDWSTTRHINVHSPAGHVVQTARICWICYCKHSSRMFIQHFYLRLHAKQNMTIFSDGGVAEFLVGLHRSPAPARIRRFFPNPAKIRLRSKFRRSRMLLPDVKNAHK